MILGIGIDIVNINRIRFAIERWGNRFSDRVFSENEKRYAFNKINPYESLAGRFAIKESFFKALGTGLRYGLTWKDIEVVNLVDNKPDVALNGKIIEVIQKRGIGKIHISISHDSDYSIGQVILTDEKI